MVHKPRLEQTQDRAVPVVHRWPDRACKCQRVSAKVILNHQVQQDWESSKEVSLRFEQDEQSENILFLLFTWMAIHLLLVGKGNKL